jgi:hypothetical protein
MDDPSLEFIDTRNVRPFPIVQRALSVNQEITPIVDNVARLKVCHLNIPLSLCAVPLSTGNAFVEGTVFAQVMFLGEAQKVFLDFVGACVDAGPVGIGIKRPSVSVGRDIACAAIWETRIAYWVMAIGKFAVTDPGYLFSSQVPPISSFFSYKTKSKFSKDRCNL